MISAPAANAARATTALVVSIDSGTSSVVPSASQTRMTRANSLAASTGSE